jgi:hypothetical protein
MFFSSVSPGKLIDSRGKASKILVFGRSPFRISVAIPIFLGGFSVPPGRFLDVIETQATDATFHVLPISLLTIGP